MDGLAECVQRNEPSQNLIELTTLLGEVNDIDPLVILEIGMHRGGSMMVWYEMLDPALLIGVDMDKPKWELGRLDNIWVIQGDSHSYAVSNQIKKRLGDDYLDFLFIDGDHTYDGVCKDFDMYSPFVRDGGIIAFHDICVDPSLYLYGEVNVAKFWGELTLVIENDPDYADWDYKAVWDEAGKGTGTGIVYVGTK